MAQRISAQWSGPLPPPATLKEFDTLVKDGAERIFLQFERQGDHRRDVELSMVSITRKKEDEDRTQKSTAQYMAFVFAMASLAIATYAMYKDAYGTALGFGCGSIALVVTAFLGAPLLQKRLDEEDPS